MPQDKEELKFSYREGYYNCEDTIEIPEGAMIPSSSNVIYNRKSRPISKKKDLFVNTVGGTRVFPLDANLIGALGRDITTNRGIGNIFQGYGKSLWFVGNSLTNSVRAWNNFTTPVAIGGVNQVETVTVTAAATANKTITVRVTSINLPSSPLDIAVAVLNGDTTSQVATKIKTAFQASVSLTGVFYPQVSSASVSITDKLIHADDVTLAIILQNANGSGVTFGASTNTTAGSLDYEASLSSTPQLAKWDGAKWLSPVQVGLAVQSTAPQLVLTSASTRDAYFDGIITGSTSVRAARKRGGTISIASPPSNVVTGDHDTSYVYMPPYADDGSAYSDRIWVLYFTYKGKGSQAAHFEFPIEIPETKLNGMETSGWTSTQGNARIKIIEQHATTQANRKIEVEFYDNDLLLLEPFDDYYSAGSSKFIAPLGNVTCLIGTGTDSTGFDVSFPNFREAYSPEWRDWFSEVPVSIASASELGMFWVLTANTVYQAIWTGATEETAPVVLRQVTSKVGAIGEGCSVSVNGVLYFLSRNKIPVRISSDMEIDIEFGAKVKNAFSSFDSTAQVGWDGATNSIVFSYGLVSIAYQIDTDKWSSLCTIGVADTITSIEACFTINGLLYGSFYDSSEFKIYQYNAGSGTINWNAQAAWQLGKSGLLLKDIIESRIISEADAQPYTITVAASKNYDTSSAATLYTHTSTVTIPKISPRKLLEQIDYDTISVKCSGTTGGQTVHLVSILADIHEIERES